MLGVGGILAEAVADVVFRPVPISRVDADEMIDGLATPAPARPVPRRGRRRPRRARRRAARPVGAGRRAARHRQRRRQPADRRGRRSSGRRRRAGRGRRAGRRRGHPPARADRRAVPRPVRAARRDRRRRVRPSRQVRLRQPPQHPVQRLRGHGRSATNLQGEEVLGVQTVADLDDLPDGADLVFVCTPAAANVAAAAGLRGQGRRAPRSSPAPATARPARTASGPRTSSSRVCDELGILLAGPNGQGVVSTPAHLCAQIVAPYPPAGRIAVASQSGNFVSSFLNYARQTGVGISRAISAGNAAAVGPADYLTWYATDDATAVSLAYVEGIADGRGAARAVHRRGGAQAARRRQGRHHRGRGARRGQPHRCAGGQRQGVRRGLPPGRRHPCRDRGGGVRGRGHVRHPAAAGRAERGRADHRRRLGRGHLRRDRRAPACSACSRCPPTSRRRSTRSCRRAGAATTRSTAPAARPATPSPT